MSRSRSSSDDKQPLLRSGSSLSRRKLSGINRQELLDAAASGSPDDVGNLLVNGVSGKRENNMVC